MDDNTIIETNNKRWIAQISFFIGLFGLACYYFLEIEIRRKPKPQKLPPNAQPDRSVIQCDEPDCSKTGPRMVCSQCKMVYYCSSDCQKRHWKYHKADCKLATEKIYTKYQRNQKTDLEPRPKPPKDSTCAICLSKDDDMKHPIVLQACQHVFCYKCLEKYEDYHQALAKQNNSNSVTPCPVCRTQMQENNVREHVLVKALLLAARAGRKSNSEQEKLEACRLALEELKALGEPESDQDVLEANGVCSRIAAVKGDYKDALKLLEQNQRIWTKLVERKKKVDTLLKKGEALGRQAGVPADDEDDDGEDGPELDDQTYQQMQQIQNEIMEIMAQGRLGNETDMISNRLEIINVYMEMEDWKTAETMYKEIMTDYPEQSMLTAPQQRQVFMGFARCLYEQGNYQGSIALGEETLKMNRHFPGIHKYVALSYKALGSLKQAQDIMAQAVLYETPWDPEHKEEVRKLWIELMEEG